ncbi:MAG: aldo/keto reductase [Actinomycetota bacterium]|nr:aldo/keto reductase [Actinomycetota bacterium]
METRPLGQLRVSVIGLGCNNFGMTIDADRTKEVVDAAIGAGINYFDTAEAYGNGLSEEYLGRALGARRSEVLVATKWGLTMSLAEGERGGDPAVIRNRLEASLKRLGTDYVDHYQLHRPDPLTPVAETLGALAELQQEGKVREIGCTHFTASELDEVYAVAAGSGLPAYPSVQNHYSLLTRDPENDGVFDACARHGIGFVPYFPLESGLLTGKYRLGQPRPEDSRLVRWGKRADPFIDDDKLAKVERLTEWAEARGHTLLELAMSWHTSHPLVSSVIAGATRPEQIHANVAAGSWLLTGDDRSAVDSLLA